MQTILVVGGTGLVGAAVALHLAERGHAVTIAGRTPPRSRPLASLSFARGSFLGDEFSGEFLAGFDALVFAAGNDARQLPAGADEDAFFHQANAIGVPAFFARARAAGIQRAVYVGTRFTALLPAGQIQADGYLRSRKAADDGVRALSTGGFRVCSVLPPMMMGHVEGVAALPLERAVGYLLSAERPWMIPGGANFMSIRSFAEAVAGALERGEPGKAYLVGDENWTFAHYYGLMLEALGKPATLPIRAGEHPVVSVHSGSENLFHEPDPTVVRLLGYRRRDAERAVREMTPYYRSMVAATSPRFEGGD